MVWLVWTLLLNHDSQGLKSRNPHPQTHTHANFPNREAKGTPLCTSCLAWVKPAAPRGLLTTPSAAGDESQHFLLPDTLWAQAGSAEPGARGRGCSGGRSCAPARHVLAWSARRPQDSGKPPRSCSAQGPSSVLFLPAPSAPSPDHVKGGSDGVQPAGNPAVVPARLVPAWSPAVPTVLPRAPSPAGGRCLCLLVRGGETVVFCSSQTIF